MKENENKINNNINISEKNKKENENAIKDCKQLIDEFIRKIYYIKRLYIYIIVKKHYCNDIKEKEKIIKDGSILVDKAKKELEILYNKILVILKKRFKGDNDLIIKYIIIIINKLKEKQKITDNDILEAKKLYKMDKIAFEKMKEEFVKQENEKEKLKNKEEDKTSLAINSNLNGRFRGLYRIWGIIIPLFYLGHYLYSNFRIFNDEQY